MRIGRGDAPQRASPGQADAGHGWSVRTYLVLIIVGAVVAVAVATAYGFLWSSGQARDDAERDMRLQARRAADAITQAVASAQRTVAGLAGQPRIERVFAGSPNCTLTAEGVGPFATVRLDIVAPTGAVGCTSAPSPRVTGSPVHAGSPWLRAVLAGAPSARVTWDATDAATGQRAVAVAAPIVRERKPVGAVVLFLPVPGTTHVLATSLASARHESFTVIRRQGGAVVASSEARGPVTSERLADRFRAAGGQGVWRGVDGSRRIFGAADIPAAGWRLFAGVRRSDVLADVRGSLQRQALVSVLALVLLVAAVWWLRRRVTRPLRHLSEAVARASHDETARVETTGPAELRRLARDVNAMLDLRAGHEAQLAHQAMHDPSTGLPNQVLLRDRLDWELRRRGESSDIAVLWLGVGRLDVVHDGFGHDVGRRVAAEVAERLSSALPEDVTLARFAHDQFVVLAPGVSGPGATELAETLRDAFGRPFSGPAIDVVLQCSIGIALSRSGATGADELLRQADSAMREAKRTGQDWTHFGRELQRRATQHLAVEHALWEALQRDEFLLHYQPLIDLATGAVSGAEALVRWRHPKRGIVAPLEFIPVAEQTGQIRAIGRVVLELACEQAGAWNAAGRRLRMSVNVAVEQLRDEGFPAIVTEMLERNRLPPGQLCLEITETALVREGDRGISALDRLRRLGVHLAIDDFGTGYSSLSYLHDLPIDELKVDRSFVARLAGDPPDTRDVHVVEAIVGMARALDLSVVAEGVETEAQLTTLTALGCSLAQGYLFGPPMTADRVPARWAGWGRGPTELRRRA